MKKIFVFFGVFGLFLVFPSCKKDDSPEPQAQPDLLVQMTNQLVGQWQSDADEHSSTCGALVSKRFRYDFRSNQTYVFTYRERSFNFLEPCDIDNETDGSYSVSMPTSEELEIWQAAFPSDSVRLDMRAELRSASSVEIVFLQYLDSARQNDQASLRIYYHDENNMKQWRNYIKAQF